MLKAASPGSLTQPIRQLPAPGIIHIHHRPRPLTNQIRRGEQQGLGLEIGLHGRVVVEMVLGEIGEDGSREATTSHAMLIEGMGAHLHGSHLGAAFQGFTKLSLQAIRHRCGVRGGEAVAGPSVHQGSKQSSRPATRLTEVFNQVGGGGFAVGAGHTDQPHTHGGPLPEGRRQLTSPKGHGIWHHENAVSRAGWMLSGSLFTDQNCSSTIRQRLWPEAASINPLSRQADEQAALANAAGITGECRHRCIRQPSRHRQTHSLEQGMERLRHHQSLNERSF